MKILKKIMIILIMLIGIICTDNKIVKAKYLDGNASDSAQSGDSYAPGEQIQQEQEKNEEEEKKNKRKEFAKNHKNDEDKDKMKYTFDEIVDYIYGNYAIEGGNLDGSLGKIDESEEVKEAWRKTLKKKAQKNDGSEAGIILKHIGKTVLESDFIFKQPSVSDSSSSTTDSIDGLLTDSETFLGKGENNKIKDESMQDFSKTMYNILITIATFVAVLVGGILGVKIMISSADEKAQVKELLIPYVIGCVVVFGAFGIWKLVVTILQNM